MCAGHADENRGKLTADIDQPASMGLTVLMPGGQCAGHADESSDKLIADMNQQSSMGVMQVMLIKAVVSQQLIWISKSAWD